MGRVLTNNVQLSYAIESSLGVLPGSPAWKQIEPNAIKKYGAQIKTTPREPISTIRQRRKGTLTDLDSEVEVDMDMTMEHFIDFIQGFCFSNFKGKAPFVPSAVTNASPSTYTVASGGALAAGTLLYGRGFTNAANNGLQVVGASSSSTTIKVTGSLVTETPPSNALLEVCGVRGASADLAIDSSGNLISTALDFTTLGLFVGQAIWIGGDLTANSFFNANNRGYARISVIAAHKLTLNKRSQSYTTDDGTSTGSGGTGLLIDIFFGRFCRNVAGNSGDYLETSFQFELTYPNLQTPGPGDMYEYALGNYCNSMTFELPLTSKALTTINFVGTDTGSPTTSRATNASSALAALKATAFNTSADVARLRATQVDETGLTTDFKSLKITLNNNVSGEKVVSFLGSKYINAGIFQLDIEADLIFTNAAVVAALRANTTVTMDFSVRNQDGAILVDIPSMTFTGLTRDFPVNQSVVLKSTASAFKDDTLGTSLGITVFAYAPVA